MGVAIAEIYHTASDAASAVSPPTAQASYVPSNDICVSHSKMRKLTAAPVLDLHAQLGEGARWDDAAGLLRFVDCGKATLHTYEPVSGRLSTRQLDLPVAAVAWTEDGVEVASAPTGFVTIDSGVAPIAEPFLDGDGEALNDARCDRRGRLWAGSYTSGERSGHGGLYCLDGFDATPRRLHGGVKMGNGLGWSPDDRWMYFVDSLRRRIDVFPFDLAAGELGAPRAFVQLDDGDGLPDGIAIDLDGCVWVAIWGPGEVRRYTPAGELDTVVTVASANATSCALVAESLFVTSAADEDERSPHPGALFTVDVGVGGLPEAAFSG
jgi:sugar lactone lactonase YvrE